MADDWDGIERRARPHEYEFRAILREELDRRDIKLDARIKPMEEKLDLIMHTSAAVKWTVLVIVSAIGTLAGIYEWMQRHIK